VISFNAIPYGMIALLVGFVARRPVHVGFVGSEAHKLDRSWLLRRLDMLLRHAAVFSVPGPTMARALVGRRYPPGSVYELPNGVDTTVFSPPEEGSVRDIDVLFMGALIGLKQVDQILRAIPLVASRLRPVTMAVVGTGPLRSELEDLVAHLDLREQVVFAGYQVDPEAWLRRARSIVIASRWEGVPFVVVEAMCVGTVPIATRVGSVPDVIDHGVNGLLLESASPDVIAAALTDVLGDVDLERRLRMGALRARERFDYASATRVWAQLIDAMRVA